MTNTFLPENYKVPSSGSRFMTKFPKGQTRFRVLSSAVVGDVYWNTYNEVKRSKGGWEKTPSDIKTDDKGNPQGPNHFWAFVAYNYEEKAIQLFEITQKTIMKAMKEYIDNEKWGDPKEYDFVVKKEGEGFQTEYSVTVEPKSDIDKDILDEYESMNVNLEALFEGQNPFDEAELEDIADEFEKELNN